MNKKFNVAILGATGAVGEIMLELLYERNFPYNNIYPLASAQSVNNVVMLGNKRLGVQDAATFDWHSVDIALFSAGSAASMQYLPLATKAGCVVIDNTSAFRMMDGVPLVIPEINSGLIADYKNHNVIANPNCIVVPAAMVLQPIQQLLGLRKVNLATYQSVSGTGRSAISELITQTTNLLSGQPVESEVYPTQIAFNSLAQIGECALNGFCDEEQKIMQETHKILADSNILINPTTVRIPTLYGHSIALHIETTAASTPDSIRELLSNQAGIVVLDDPENNIVPSTFVDATGRDEVFVGRIRHHPKDPTILNMWVVSDNVRKGAALNSIQIAEILVDRYI